MRAGCIVRCTLQGPGVHVWHFHTRSLLAPACHTASATPAFSRGMQHRHGTHPRFLPTSDEFTAIPTGLHGRLASVFHGRSLRLPRLRGTPSGQGRELWLAPWESVMVLREAEGKEANCFCASLEKQARALIGFGSWCARRHSRGGVRVRCGRAASSV